MRVKHGQSWQCWYFGWKAINLRTGRNAMTIKVDLNPDIGARLTAEARSLGVPLEKLAERLLAEALTIGSLPHGALSVEEFHHLLADIAEGSDKLPDLPTQSFSRESFYEDRVDDRRSGSDRSLR